MKAFAPILALLVIAAPPGLAAESEAKSAPGIAEARLLTPVSAVRPTSTFTVGLLLRPEPGFHTYWRGPGIVGVATSLNWDLPEGFEAGQILWPPPEKTDMVGITANGYRSEVLLLTEIRTPEKIEADSITIDVTAAWMACSTSCHPSIESFSLVLPVAASGEPARPSDPLLAARFERVRNSIPADAPDKWRFSAERTAPDRIVLRGEVPGLTQEAASSLVFYSDDMQVDSDHPPRIEWLGGETSRFAIHFRRPDFAPADPERFSGLLRNPSGWKGLENECVEISIPWRNDEGRDE